MDAFSTESHTHNRVCARAFAAAGPAAVSGVPSIEDVTHIEAQPKSAAQAEEEEVLHASIKAGSVAQIVVAIVAVLGLVYLLKVVMVTTLGAVLLAFIVEPLVSWLERMKVPRTAGALLGVTLLIVLSLGLTYFFYSRAVDFSTQLPKYSNKIRETVGRVRSQTSKIAQSTRSVVGPGEKTKAIPVQVKPELDLISMVSGDGN